MAQELHYPISMSKLPSSSQTVELPINDDSLASIAEACGVSDIKKLTARFRFKRWRKHGLTLTGEFHAEIEQECIATLEPVFTKLNENFERQFLPERSSEYKLPEIIDGEMILDPEANDLPDIIEGDTLNLWDVLIEEMILAIDPFPRSETADNQAESVEETPEELPEPTHKPFSDLKTLISQKKSNK